MEPRFNWTDARIARAIAMKAQGRSLTEIAKHIGTNKNRVAGKLFRIGATNKRAAEPRHALPALTDRAKYHRQVGVNMDNETYAELRRYAERRGQTLPAACRDFIQWGLMDYGDD